MDLIVGADGVIGPEGNSGTRMVSVPDPPGSESGARMQGLSRNLGDLSVSTRRGAELNGAEVPVVEGNQRHRDGRAEVGSPHSTFEAGEPTRRDSVEERG